MEDFKEKNIEDIFNDGKDYIDARINYIKLSLVEKVSKVFADLVTNTIVIISFVLAFLFASVTLALYLSHVFGSNTAGFGCVAGIYFLISIVVFLTKDNYIEKMLINLFIKKYFDKVADKEEDEDENKL